MRAGSGQRGSDAEAGLLPEDFPRKLGRLQVLAGRARRAAGPGHRPDRRTGRGLVFADHRGYVPGDDLRHLDWHLYARHDRPLVRLHEREADLALHVLLDRSASMGFGNPSKLRLGAQLAATLCLLGLARRDRVHAHAYAERLQPLPAARAGLPALARALGRLPAAGGTALAAAVRELLARRPPRGLCVILSDFLDLRELERALALLGRAGMETVLLQIQAPEELHPERAARPGETLRLRDAERAAEHLVVLTPALLAAYHDERRTHAERCARLCARHRARLLRVASTQRLEDVALRLLRRAGVIGR